MTRSILLPLVLALGCAASGGGLVAPAFPSRAQVAAMAAVPPPERLTRDKLVEVDRWELAGPLPDGLAQGGHAPATPWEVMFAQALAGRADLRASEGMHCTARETARFVLAREGFPLEDLRRFIAARCGAASPAPAVAHLSWKAPAALGDETLLEQVRKEAADFVRTSVPQGLVEAGAWYGRQGERALLLVAAGERRTDLDAATLRLEGGRIRLSGQLIMRADRIQGLVNRGRYGFGECEVDPAVSLPRFAITCRADEADQTTWVEIAAFEPGRVLGPIVVDLLATVATAPNTWTAPAVEGALAEEPADLKEPLVSFINRVRTEATLDPLVLDGPQSHLATRLAPHYFAALGGMGDERQADRIALGLRAGWEIGGEIREGHFSGYFVSGGGRDVGRLVATALEHPGARRTLLARDARKVAVGPVKDEAQRVVGAVFTSYSFYESGADQQGFAAVVGLVGRERRRLGKSAIVPAPELRPILAAVGERVARGELSPDDALSSALQTVVERTGKSARGWVLETQRMDDLTLPRDLVDGGMNKVAIHVGHYAPKGEAWARFFVIILATESGAFAA